MQKDQAMKSQVGYVIKVLLGLAMVTLEAAIASGLPELITDTTARQAAIAVLVVIMLLQVPLLHWLYRRADELQQFMHHQASARSLVWLATGCGIAGVLQANSVIPAFNQFWMLAALVAVWGVQLMLADRPHH